MVSKTKNRSKSFKNLEQPKSVEAARRAAHHLEISYYVNFLGRLGSNGFQLK